MKKLISILFLILLFSGTSHAFSFHHIGLDEGLSHPTVLSICQDDLGRIWFGTREGLSIYNGRTMKILIGETTAPNGRTFDIGSHISFIRKDDKGNMFVIAERNLFLLNSRANYFEQLTHDHTTEALKVEGDSIWYVDNQKLMIYRPSLKQHYTVKELSVQKIRSLEIIGDEVLIGSLRGLYSYSLKHDTFTPLVERGVHIFKLFRNSRGEVWVGTSREGIYKYVDRQLIKLPEFPNSDQDIKSNPIRDFIEDSEGNIWIATSKGLYKYNLSQNKFYSVNPPQYLGGFKDPSVYCLYFDQQQNIWAGTIYGGASYFNPLKNKYTDYVYQGIDPSKKEFRIIGQMVFDKRETLWACTEGEGVFALNRKYEIVKRFHTQTPQALGSNVVKTIAYDEEHDRLFMGTMRGGLSVYDFEKQQLSTFQIPDIRSKIDHNNMIYHLELDNGLVYFSTPKAIYRFDPQTGKFTFLSDIENYCYHFKINRQGLLFARSHHSMKIIPVNHPEQARTVDFKPDYQQIKISSFVTDDESVYIFTYGNGIFHYHPETHHLTNYNTQNSNLPTNYCYVGKYTRDNRIVITCSKGVIMFNPEKKTFALIDRFERKNPIIRNSGLLVSSTNDLYVGGANGITKMVISDINLQVDEESTLYFFDLYVNNTLIEPYPDQDILTTDMPYTRSIHLDADENNILINLAYKDCTAEHNWQNFSYKLEGLDDDWNRSTIPSIHYHHLPPGDYTLKVKMNTLGSSPVTSLKIHIANPIYAQWWAICLYLGTGGLLLFLFHRNRIRHQKLVVSLQNEKFEKQQIERLNHEKLVFFTNVSHEFRTPLTLIISHVDSLLGQSALPVSIYNLVYKIKRNSVRMNNLVTELLDFKKFSEDRFTLDVSQNDYVSYLQELYLMYTDFARQRNIHFLFEPQETTIRGWFDTKHMDKVLLNLLSNAFKYTPDGGSITLRAKTEGTRLRIEISDTGVGIAKEDICHLFNRFYQGNNQQGQEHSPGTGIGLTLSKLIVEKHHGTIVVDSELGKGSTFAIVLPLEKEIFEGDSQVHFQIHTEQEGQEPDTDKRLMTPTFQGELEASLLEEWNTEDRLNEVEEDDEKPARPHKYTVLLVEDNPEVLEVLYQLFKDQFEILKAHNGKEGLEKTFEFKPDLIISDIMMPEMNGTEMCLQIKENIDLCHIPIILLTALTGEQQNIEGLNRGADDYICKPFNAKLLLARANSLIRNRLLIQSQISKKPITEVDLTSINPIDQKILKKAEEVLDKNLDNPEFGVADLCLELSMGRSLLFTKFKALTGQTPNKFILNFRLRYAASMLHHHPEMLVTEVSDRCGFGSAIYFSRCFKNQYGVSPQNYRKQES